MGLETAVPCKAGFPRSREVTYLDTAAEGLPPEHTGEALARYYRDKASGSPGRRQFYRVEAETLRALAGLLRTEPERVALLASTSDGLNLLANSIDWRPGDEVLIDDLEFPSNVLAWLPLRERGVRVRLVNAEGGTLRLEQFASQIGPATRIVSISQVSYKSGTHCRFLPALAAEVHRVGGFLCVDATQALARVPVSVEGVDYLVASTYKWLLGAHGLGVVYLAPTLEERLLPGGVGWYSVRDLFAPDRFERFALKPGAARFTLGMPNFPSIYALQVAVEFLQSVGIERLDLALRPLIEKLRRGLEGRGLDLLTPPGTEYASGIVSFAHALAPQIGAGLETEGVIVWAGDGRVRTSMHLYNDESDVERMLEVLDKVLAAAEKSRA